MCIHQYEELKRRQLLIPSCSQTQFCFIQFLVLSWLHNRHANIFHGKDLNHNEKCEENSVQFLIHPSGRNADHEDYKETMDSCLRDFRKYMESKADQDQFIDIFFANS